MADANGRSVGSSPTTSTLPSKTRSWGLLFTICTISLLLAAFAPLVQASPVPSPTVTKKDEPEPLPAGEPGLWVYLSTAVALVLLGGVFAGLTIALMGQDEIYLQVIATSGEPHERRNAKKVLRLLQRGKHWVLVTLLLGNVITNETLPIVLDRSLGGGWPAVLGSTVLIVIFGEIAPQSVCVRYGLPIGAWMSPFVLVLMWLLCPVAWPIAKLLDYLLGEDHGTTYKKAGLKTLVTLHRTLGQHPGERLNEDEVTIISAVLDLKEKPVGSIMTPMSDVFTLAADTVLDEAMMDGILSEGYSRIPIYAVDKPRDFIGMLLVKMLITYDPEDCLRVKDFQLATLPETRPETSCLDIVNFFQEGKSHMVLVSDSPGEPQGAMGVVTLEDVIEELIGEEIIDESDVFIDVHKAIRRLQPAPRYRVPKGEIVATENHQSADPKSPIADGRHSRTASVEKPAKERKPSLSDLARSPPNSSFLMRRRSSGADPITQRTNQSEMRQQLKHLGPSNVASRPKQTRINTVKIKPGTASFFDQLVTLPETGQLPRDGNRPPSRAHSLVIPYSGNTDINESTGLLSAGRIAKDGAHAVHAVGYGALSSSPTAKMQDLKSLVRPPTNESNSTKVADDEGSKKSPSSPDENAQQLKAKSPDRRPSSSRSSPTAPAKLVLELTPASNESLNINVSNTSPTSQKDDHDDASKRPSMISHHSTSTLGSLHSIDSGERKTRPTRSGSITQHTIEVGGVKKVILETTSSSDESNGDAQQKGKENGTNGKGKVVNGEIEDVGLDGAVEDGRAPAGGKKKRKKRSGKKKGKGKESELNGSSK